MTLPVVQAPIGRATTPELAAAVSNAGGLGMLALSWTRPDQVRGRIQAVQALTSKAFGVNLVLQWPQQERLSLCLDEQVAVVSTFWGDPAPYVPRVRDAGALHVHTVASAAEARRAVDAGVDAVVAQGAEAGGHVWGDVSTLALVPAVVDAVHPVPVLAAGGIADGRGLAAALALGASAGWIGTRFVASDEANAHPEYQARLRAASETDTSYGTVFDGGWPDAPHRTLRNSTLAAWEAAGRPPAGRRPGEGEAVGTGGRGAPLPRYSSDLPTRTLTGDVEATALYAGQGTALIHDVRPAAEIARTMSEQAQQVLRRLAATGGR
jgi:NAD(P)H-dependent flavin oxidoreductase YrpB (nitropropane dioxygenase family)